MSLNWRTLANPEANAISVTGSAVVCSSTRAVCARWARARATGPAPELGGELALHLAGAVAEPHGEPRDALAVDDSVTDQPHGPADDIGAHVPLGGAGHGVRAAAAAGPEAGALRGGGRRDRSARSAASG